MRYDPTKVPVVRVRFLDDGTDLGPERLTLCWPTIAMLVTGVMGIAR